MKQSNREKLIVAIAAILFFAAFGTIAMMDRSHGVDGEGVGANDVDVDVGKNEGHITITSLPDDFLVFAAGSHAKVDFKVENNDRDNDIDTIQVQVPGSMMVNGSSLWYIPTALDHEWNYNGSFDMATFQAEDDIRGRVFGGSAQYDVVGNIDDALDHFSINETILVEVSEAVTVTAEFMAPSTAGIKYQNDGIQVIVGDLMTEDTGDEMTSLYPDGYPYMVIEDGFEFIFIEVDSTDIDLEVQYGTETLFSGSRAITDYEISEYGIKFASDGSTYAFLDVPENDEEIKPIIKGLDGATDEDVMVRLQDIVVTDVTASGNDLFNVENENITTLPMPGPGVSLIDTDGDFIYDVNDDDDDNDGIPDERDPFPKTYGTVWKNVDPVIHSIRGPANRVEKGSTFTLEVSANDTDRDPLTYVWSVSGSDWTDEGDVVIIMDTYTTGTFTYTVTVTDGKGGSDTDQIEIEIYEEDEPSGGWFIYLIIGALLFVVVVIVLFFIIRNRGEEEEEEIPEEIPPQEPMGGFEEPDADYEEDTETIFDGIEDEMMEETQISPPMPIEEEMEEEEEDETPPMMGSVPIVSEEEDGQIPALPGEIELPEIQDLEQLIDEMERTEEEVGDLCPECSAPLGPYDTECSSCGAQFEVAMECPNCGSVVEEDVDKCPNCGVSFI